MNRRVFAKSGLLAGLVAIAAAPACWLENIYGQLRQYIPLALLAFDRIIEILAEHNIVVSPNLTDAVNAVKAALADVQSAILEFEHALSHGRDTAIAAIRTALLIARNTLEEFWRKLNLPAGQLAATVHALLMIIINALTAFESRLPGSGPGPLVPHSAFHSVGKPPTLKEFREDFNGVIDRAGEGKRFHI